MEYTNLQFLGLVFSVVLVWGVLLAFRKYTTIALWVILRLPIYIIIVILSLCLAVVIWIGYLIRLLFGKTIYRGTLKDQHKEIINMIKTINNAG